MTKKYSFGILCILALSAICMQSCNLINPPETIPCYGHIDSINVTTNYSIQGTASSKISCAWVYVDDQPVGTFEMPCTFPMIATSGTHTISIYPGVTADGAASTREKYNFLNYYSAAVNITQGAVTKFKFTAQYQSTVQFDWKEDFEEPTVFSFTRDTNGTDTNQIHKIGHPYAFQGNWSGQVVLDSSRLLDSVMIYRSFTDTMSLPHDGSSVFIELNYNTNTTFYVGVCANSPTNLNYYTGGQNPTFAAVLPSSSWQKIYIDITSALANQTGGIFRIMFTMYRQKGTNAKLLLDNLKVLHYKGS